MAAEYKMSEDCLYLNILPRKDKRRIIFLCLSTFTAADCGTVTAKRKWNLIRSVWQDAA